MIYGVVGVTLWTDNLEKLRGFYEGVLQMPVHSDHGDFVAFRWGNMRLNLGLHSKVKGYSEDPYRIMLHLGVKDIHNLVKRLTSRGVEVIRPPEKEAWGGWIATIKDPDGNVVQFLQLPEDAA